MKVRNTLVLTTLEPIRWSDKGHTVISAIALGGRIRIRLSPLHETGKAGLTKARVSTGISLVW